MDTNLIDSNHPETSVDQQEQESELAEQDHDDIVLSPEDGEEAADTYPLCDNEPTSESISSAKPDTDPVEELRGGQRAEHIRAVKHKKEAADVLRLRRFQEQLQKKEEKWQQQQLERVQKWLQLRNRDTDHRSQVEERRRQRDEEAKAKVDEIVRREKAREQRTPSQLIGSPRVHALHHSSPSPLISLSADHSGNRRSLSSARAPSNQLGMTHRCESTESPMPVGSDHSASANSSHQVNPIDGHRYHRASPSPRDATLTNEDSSVSGTARSRTRPMPASYTYWLNTGDATSQNNAHFMRLTYAATCRSRLSRSVERCPRACRGREELPSQPTPTNGEPQRRIQSVNRQQLNESISRLSKPKTVPGIPMSQSSYQLRASTPPVTSSNASTPRKFVPTRSIALASSSSHATHSTHDFRASPTNDSSPRPRPPSKPPLATTSKPPVSSSPRPKPPVPRPAMNTSLSSSSISSPSTIIQKANQRRAPPVSSKPKSGTVTPTKDDENRSITSEPATDERLPVTEPVDAEASTDPVTNFRKEQQLLDEQEYQRKLSQKIREAQQRLEVERQQEEERLRQLEFEELEREQEQIRLVEEQRQAEEERLQRAIEECQRENELKRQEEQRLQQQRDELEKRQTEEADRLQRERQEKAKKEEEERIERKKRLDLIMRRTRPVSPNSKSDHPGSKSNANESNGHDQSMIIHSISEQHFSSNSSSTENILDQSVDGPKLKNPLIQDLLNKARTTRSTDNLTRSGIATDTPADSSEEEQDSTGTAQAELPSPRSLETAAAFQ